MPNFLISGRTINNNMPIFIVDRVIGLLKKQKLNRKINAFIAGLTLRKMGDLRNSKVFEIINLLIKKNIKVTIFDPLVDKSNLPPNSKKLFKENIIYEKLKTDIFIIAIPQDM